MTSVKWSRRALSDLEAIAAFIAADDPRAARAWIKRLWDRAILAAEFPHAGRIVPEEGRENLREVFVRSYRLVYQVQTDGILVVTVFEGHRSLTRDDLGQEEE